MEIEKALNNQEFEMYLQPQIDLKTRKVVGAEALIRWNSPEKGQLLPDEFIPWCEKYGKIEYIDRFVLEKVCGYVSDIPLLVEHIKRLKEAGFKIAMDDFGEGYASLKMMQMLPIDSIKLDKGFLETIPQLTKSKKLIKSIIYMAEELGLQVTAEGIENSSQLQFLEQIGCDKVQGYLFSKPLSIEKYEKQYF